MFEENESSTEVLFFNDFIAGVGSCSLNELIRVIFFGVMFVGNNHFKINIINVIIQRSWALASRTINKHEQAFIIFTSTNINGVCN